jgi:hypothetical protein
VEQQDLRQQPFAHEGGQADIATSQVNVWKRLKYTKTPDIK